MNATGNFIGANANELYKQFDAIIGFEQLT